MAGARSRPNPVLVLIKLIGAIVVAGILASGFVLPYIGGVGLAAKREVDKFNATTCDVKESPPPAKTHIYASDGKTLIATVFKQDRQPVTLNQISPWMVKALVSTEDRRFYSHHGVDLRGLLRSAVSTGSGDTQGGSTLTMQYVKQLRYYQAGDNKAKQEAAIAQNITRKMEDAQCALYFEGAKHESKATILDNYLNIAFFGENSYGIQTAARTYFNKNAKDLTVPEASMLVGLLRAPDAYDPFQYPKPALERRNEVLQNMVTTHDLTQAQADQYKQTPVRLATAAPPPLREGCANSPSKIANVGFFCDYVVNWILQNTSITEAQLQTGGLNIQTTLNPDLQNSMQTNLSKALSSKSAMTAIMPAVDPKTGDILAMATTRRYGTKQGETTLPIFTSYTAQGASTYKLFPLLTALGIGVPDSWTLQTPSAYTTYQWTKCPQDSNGDVKNGDANETFLTNETLADATAKSANTFFTGVADQLFSCQLQPIIDTAQALGMQAFQQPSGDQGLTVAQDIMRYSAAKLLVLGDVATSPLELTSAYAAVANDGLYEAPVPVSCITAQKVSVCNQAPVTQRITLPQHRTRQAVTPEAARRAISILHGDTVDTGTSAAEFTNWYASHPAALISGKTGTAPGIDPKTKKDDKNGALWFVGMTPNIVATTALINLDHPSAPASDLPGVADPADNAYGSYSAGLWIKALGPTLAAQTPWTWQPADAVNGQAVPPITGYTIADATAKLKAAGYTLNVLGGANSPVLCASPVQPAGAVAFAGPAIAPPNAGAASVITVCESSGFQQQIYVKPKPTYTPTHTRGSSSSNAPGSGTSSSSGGGSTPPGSGGGSSGGGGGGSTPPGHGGGRPPRPGH